MSIIYLLIPIAMLFVAIAVGGFFWAVKSNQYEDLDREAMNILFDEESPALHREKKQNREGESDHANQ